MNTNDIADRLTDLMEDVVEGEGEADEFNNLIEDLEEDGRYPQIKENVEEMKVSLMNGADRQTVVLLLDTVSLLQQRETLEENP